MNYDQAYVIGFKEIGAERLKRFFSSSRHAGLDVQLFPAVNGKTLNIEDYRKREFFTDDFELRMPGSSPKSSVKLRIVKQAKQSATAFCGF